jgi:type I restriction enzyme M protein
MDDMDTESEEMGGERKFFAGNFSRYGWAKLMYPGIGGHEMLGLYAEGISKMPENPGVPLLFREIFKNAFLPYRDPETLKSFLKVINEFSYDHSERLGDAFEYLLSVLGSQGDAGQFRTPRDIIDFIVSIVDPRKDETILDPACGTAGFLIAAYKHILRSSTDASGRLKLALDERARLAESIKGYDISPDMVRLSLVNLYLHGFTDPHIYEYDTLTQEERWNEIADVILANPPFMSPKGGIRPHRRFSVPSSRSEVLFVDYILEHLTMRGRAGVIVPEGIIFQSGVAYRRLREALVKDALIGVISLPSGVFQPYSGVKTSILILDKRTAKNNPKILFSEVKAIGVSLGVKRTITEQNDLPHVLNDYAAYYEGKQHLSPHSWLVERNLILADECNLSGSRYRPIEVQDGVRLVRLGDICSFTKGSSSSTKTEPGPYPLIVTAEDWLTSSEYQIDGEAVCVPLISSTGHGRASLKRIHFAAGRFALANLLVAIQPEDPERLDIRFLFLVLDSHKERIAKLMKGAANVSMKVEDLAQFQIPLPPIKTQAEFVTEVKCQQKVIDGARAVLDNYRPRIPIHPDWPEVALGQIVKLSSGGTPSRDNEAYWIGNIPWVSAKDMKADVLSGASTRVSEAAITDGATRIAPVGSILILVRGMGLANGVPICELAEPCAFNQDVKAMLPSAEVNATFLRVALKQQESQFKAILETAAHGTLKINTDDLLQIRVPLPPLSEQEAMVAEIEADRDLVIVNRQIVTRFEKKLRATLDRIWGEDDLMTVGA